MKSVNKHEAKTNPSELMVGAVPLNAPAPNKARRLGFMAGRIEVPGDFDRMGEEEIARLFSAGS